MDCSYIRMRKNVNLQVANTVMKEKKHNFATLIY